MDRLTLPADRAGFVRRECPHCHRAFKTRRLELDQKCLQRKLQAAMGAANLDEAEEPKGLLTCLYCGAQEPADRFFTLPHRGLVDRACAEVRRQMGYQYLSLTLHAFPKDFRPTFLPVPPVVRWPVGVEADDMKVILLPCCGEEVKGQPSDAAVFYCPLCGLRHGPVGHQAARSLHASLE